MKEFEITDNYIKNLPNDIINYLKAIVLNKNSKNLKEVCKSAIINRECKNRAINFIENLTLKERYHCVLKYYGDKTIQDLKDIDYCIIHKLTNTEKYLKNDKNFRFIYYKCLEYYLKFNNVYVALPSTLYNIYTEFSKLIDYKEYLSNLIKLSDDDNFNYSQNKLFIPREMIINFIKLKNYDFEIMYALQKFYRFIKNFENKKFYFNIDIKNYKLLFKKEILNLNKNPSIIIKIFIFENFLRDN